LTQQIPLRATVRAGEWLAISSQLGLDKDDVLAEGITSQTATALRNLRSRLSENGLELADVVKVNVYLTTMDHYREMNEEYSKVFSGRPPARTAVAVHELPLGGLVEIEAWAYNGREDA
jgi:2-iminobutanoate/2-iminopropanoate deaminase